VPRARTTSSADGVLITRPEPGAAETAARLAAVGLRAIVAPLFTIESRPIAATPAQAVLVTSANALPALPASLRATPLLAVGDATAAKARALGFATVQSAGGDAVALAALAARRCAPERGPLLLASGARQGMALVRDLRARGFTVRRRIAYAARPVAVLPEPAAAALREGGVGAALFFSADAARVFIARLRAALGERAVAPVEALAISRTVAEALRPLPWRRIRVASHPTQDEVLKLLS
jgi:uroporphyrinogen-III synthase